MREVDIFPWLSCCYVVCRERHGALSRECLRNLLSSKGGADVSLHHLYGACVVATVGNDDVGVLFGGFDKFVVHGFEHIAIFADQHVERMSAFGNVSFDDAKQALIGAGVYEDLKIHQFAERFVVKSHYTFDDDDIAWSYANGFFATCAGEIRVGGLFDGLTLPELFNLLYK